MNYAYEGRSDIERSPFTLVLVGAIASSDYAIRVLCHDRRLDKRDRSNPDADREVVKLDDKEVHLESDRFLERYAVSTDHDQDQIAVWQLFSPGIIQWLTEEAPERFSFELQDGALACFVPGYVADEDELDALCAAAARDPRPRRRDRRARSRRRRPARAPAGARSSASSPSTRSRARRRA